MTERRVRYRNIARAGLMVLACLVAACQGPQDSRRLHQFLGGKDQEPPPPAQTAADPRKEQIGLAKPTPLGSAMIEQPSSDAAVPTLSAPELYPGTGFGPQPAAQINPVVLGANDDVTLNFVNADVREVVNTVLGTTLQLNFVIDPRVQGVITVRTTRPVPKAKVIGLLEDVLAINGIAIVEQNGIYKILPVEEAATPPKIVGDGSGGPVRVQRGFGLHVIPLTYASAAALREVLEAFVPPGRVLRVDAARNLVIFVGSSTEAKDIDDLIGTFDVNWMTGMSFALLPLQVADPEAMAEELGKIFAQEEGGALAGVVQFVPIKRLGAVLVITPEASYLNQARQWVARLDRGQEGDQRKLYVYYVQNGRAGELADVLGQVFGIETGTTTLEERPGLAPGLTPVEMGGGGGGGLGNTGLGSSSSRGNTGLGSMSRSSSSAYPSRTGGLGGTGTTGGTTGGTSRRSLAATGGSATGGGAFASAEGATQNGVRIVADTRNNALVVYATPQEYATINGALAKLDIVPLQVMIEATIAEVTLNDALKYGVEWFFNVGDNTITFNNSSGKTAAPVQSLLQSAFPGLSYLFATDDVKVVINALSQVTDLKVISSPQLLVLDNETARLQVGDEVPILTSTSTGELTGGNVVQEVEYRDTGVILDIIPRVNASGLVVLDILQEVSDVVAVPAESATAIQQATPTISQRQIASTVAVNSGETIALGGLIREANENTVNGVPLLSEIPILGNLFKTTSDNARRTELLILLTPHVIRDRQDARTMTDDLRKRLRALPGLVPKIQ